MVRSEALTTPHVSESIQTAIEPAKLKTQLRAEQIFVSPDDILLTEYGSSLQAVIVFEGMLENPGEGISDGRIREIKSEIEKLCQVSGIDVLDKDLRSQFKNIVTARLAGKNTQT
ncbi:MAG: hypothetical protein HYW62_02525 [Candidatus Levybacteria bacterium]|nr:hypothetical protein [Candidatus Levybacteria bacterium]